MDECYGEACMIARPDLNSARKTLFVLILKFSKRPFVRNVVTVASGTAASQVIVMAFTPLLTRLYGPEAYGILGVFMSIAGVLAAVSALTYPVAIVLPKTDEDALGLARLSLYVGMGMPIIVSINLFFFGPVFLSLLNATEVLPLMYLIPVFMFTSVVSTVVGQWLIRKKAFSLTATVTVWHALVINIIKIGMGLVHPSAAVLVVTNTLGVLLTAVMMLIGLRKAHAISHDVIKNIELRPSPWMLAKRHRDFPFLRTPQVLLNSVSHSLPIIMLAAFYGPTSAGFYSIALAVLGIPIVLIGGSVMQVFYPRINEAINRGENTKSLIIKTTVALVLSGVLPFVIVIIAGPMLFSFVFGAEWRDAGIYAQWLSLWLFFQYINKPAVAAIPALQMQKGLLIYELVSTATKVIALYLGYAVFESDVTAIALFSLSGVAAYTWLILWVIAYSGKLPVKPLSL